MNRLGLKNKLRNWLTTMVIRVVSLLPLPVAQTIGTLIGWLNWATGSRSAKVTETNLRLCLQIDNSKTLQLLTKRSLIETGKTLMEIPRVWLGDITKSRALIKAVHQENLLTEAISAGKGVIIILPHLGNWEMFNPYYNQSTPMIGLYSPPDNEYLAKLLDRVRNRMGNKVVPTTKAGLTLLYKALGRGEIVTILPDQVPAAGEFAPFFSVPAFTDLLIPRLIRKTGARVVCAFVKRNKDKTGFEVVFRPASAAIASDDLHESVEALNQSIENCVREIPEQYQWEYKRFRVRPEGLSKIY
jgi:KDO2-lipid IV(A) lauroyltransferase